MPDLIGREDFGAALLDAIKDFDCGDEAWSTELSEWIRCVRGDESALGAMATRGTKVWLYRNQAYAIVGFGSLGVTEFRLPNHRDPFKHIPYIPMFAVGRHYRGQPQGTDEISYATQMMDDLQGEARLLRTTRNDLFHYLGLHVRIENHRAIRFYEKYGFTKLHKPHKGLWRMVLNIAESAATS